MSVAPRLRRRPGALYVGMRMTAKEFFRIPDDGQFYELIDGVVIVSPSPTPRHNSVAGEVHRRLANYLKERPIGFAFIESDVHIGQGPTGGDIVYRAEVTYFSRLRVPASPNEHLVGPPDLMVEVISDSSRLYDTVTKFKDYERFGVTEYWIFDPTVERMTFYRLRRGKYVEVPAAVRTFRHQAVPGFVLDLKSVRAAFKPW